VPRMRIGNRVDGLLEASSLGVIEIEGKIVRAANAHTATANSNAKRSSGCRTRISVAARQPSAKNKPPLQINSRGLGISPLLAADIQVERGAPVARCPFRTTVKPTVFRSRRTVPTRRPSGRCPILA
jgi:hypothetical protein